MGSGYLLSPLMLIINTIFDLHILLVLLRFLFLFPVSAARTALQSYCACY